MSKADNPSRHPPNPGGGIWAVVPVKGFDAAKQRLADALGQKERRQLARRMFEDVLEALFQAADFSGIMVVTHDAAVRNLAKSFGARILAERRDQGLSAAVEQAASVLAGEGAGALFMVPSDVPLITRADIEAVLTAHGSKTGPRMTIVPAWDQDGTNCLVCSPPDLIPFRFGAGSFEKHLAEARAIGVVPQCPEVSNIGLDIDGMTEISMLMKAPIVSRAQQFLQRSGFAEADENECKIGR